MGKNEADFEFYLIVKYKHGFYFLNLEFDMEKMLFSINHVNSKAKHSC